MPPPQKPPNRIVPFPDCIVTPNGNETLQLSGKYEAVSRALWHPATSPWAASTSLKAPYSHPMSSPYAYKQPPTPTPAATRRAESPEQELPPKKRNKTPISSPGKALPLLLQTFPLHIINKILTHLLHSPHGICITREDLPPQTDTHNLTTTIPPLSISSIFQFPTILSTPITISPHPSNIQFNLLKTTKQCVPTLWRSNRVFLIDCLHGYEKGEVSVEVRRGNRELTLAEWLNVIGPRSLVDFEGEGLSEVVLRVNMVLVVFEVGERVKVEDNDDDGGLIWVGERKAGSKEIAKKEEATDEEILRNYNQEISHNNGR